MLQRLLIDNYALIDKSVIDFTEGFTVITGETGAGKSIMLGALSLLMGARADSKVMGAKDRKTVVEALFTHPDAVLKEICEENGIDWDDNELILRREISTGGKSRGFVNDTPVNLTVMSAVAEHLLDIHSQHSNSLLSKPREQLAIIDAFGNNSSLMESYRGVFRNYVNLRNKIKSIKENIATGKENREYLMFRLEQLEKIKPKEGELSSLERQAELLGDADKIKSGLTEAQYLLDGEGNSVLRLLQNVSAALENVDFELLDPSQRENVTDRLNSLRIDLKDISDTLEGYADKIDSDPERYEKVQQRIETLYDAMKRFKVKDESELVNLHRRLREELENIGTDASELPGLESQLKEMAKDLKEKAETLTEARQKAAIGFSEEILKRIQPLGLPNVKFQVEIERGKLSQDGQDNLTFYCSFNKNHPMQPVSEIASGGEIARVMLGVKSVMAEKMHLPTVIFDEIDTGVSGEIAHKMGSLMKEMSGNMQVMAVTHLPQVAANGNYHLKVYKSDKDDKTVSMIRPLEDGERVIEIAGMLSGTTINEIALENARILLDNKE